MLGNDGFQVVASAAEEISREEVVAVVLVVAEAVVETPISAITTSSIFGSETMLRKLNLIWHKSCSFEQIYITIKYIKIKTYLTIYNIKRWGGCLWEGAIVETVLGSEVKWSDPEEALFNQEVLESGQVQRQPILETF